MDNEYKFEIRKIGSEEYLCWGKSSMVCWPVKSIIGISYDMTLESPYLNIHRQCGNQFIVDTWTIAQGYPVREFVAWFESQKPVTTTATCTFGEIHVGVGFDFNGARFIKIDTKSNGHNAYKPDNETTWEFADYAIVNPILTVSVPDKRLT